MSAVAIAGASGMLGRRLMLRFLEHGQEVHALVRDPHSLAPEPGLQVFPWSEGPARGLASSKVLIYAAGYIPEDLEDPHEATSCLDVNAVHALEWMMEAVHIGVKHIIYFSSVDAYLPILYPPGREHRIREDQSLYPAQHASFYLASKVCGELWATRTGGEGVWVTIFRLSTLFGPGARRGFVRWLVDRIVNKQPIVLPDGGRNELDLIYADDVVDCVSAAIESHAVGAFNIASSVPRTTLDLARATARALAVSDTEIGVAPVCPVPVHRCPVYDIGRARRDLGFEPRTFEAGLREMLGERAH